MAKTVFYAAKRHGLYLHGIEPNENYAPSVTAPTMGRRYTYNEFSTVWGKEPKYFEPLTFVSNLQVILSEYRWECRKTEDFRIICTENIRSFDCNE